MSFLKQATVSLFTMYSFFSFAQIDIIRHITCDLKIINTKNFLPSTLTLVADNLRSKGYNIQIIKSKKMSSIDLKEGSTLLLDLNFNDPQQRASTCQIFSARNCKINIALSNSEVVKGDDGYSLLDTTFSSILVNLDHERTTFVTLGLNLGADSERSHCDNEIEEMINDFPACEVVPVEETDKSVSNASRIIKEALEYAKKYEAEFAKRQ